MNISQRAEIGDLILVKVIKTSDGYCSLENIHGRSEILYENDYFIGVLGNRYSCQNYYGHWESAEIFRKDITLLTNGGILGICDDAPLYKGKEITLQVIGCVMSQGRKMNIKEKTFSMSMKKSINKNLIFVCGTSGETGKTTVSKSIIYQLKQLTDWKVGGVKLSGTGCMEDILEMADAGADEVGDLCDVGLPSSYDSYTHVKKGIKKLLSSEKFSDMDVIICEFGGDITGGNVENVLQDNDFMKYVKKVVVTYFDVAGLLTVKSLFTRWSIPEEKVCVAHNIYRNITAINERLDYWNVNYSCYEVFTNSHLEYFVNEGIIKSVSLLNNKETPRTI